MESKRKQTNRKQFCSQSFSLQCISSLVISSQWRNSLLVAYWSKYILMKKKFSFYAKTNKSRGPDDIPPLQENMSIYYTFSITNFFKKNPSNGYLSNSLEDSHSCAPLQKKGQVASVKLPTSFFLGYCRKVFRSHYIQTTL